MLHIAPCIVVKYINVLMYLIIKDISFKYIAQ